MLSHTPIRQEGERDEMELESSASPTPGLRQQRRSSSRGRVVRVACEMRQAREAERRSIEEGSALKNSERERERESHCTLRLPLSLSFPLSLSDS